jgi:hypothetical protein
MWNFVIPEPQTLHDLFTVNSETQEQQPVRFSFAQLMHQFVLGDPAWLASSDAAQAHARVAAALGDCEPGARVVLSDGDFDLFKPCALRAGSSLADQSPLKAPLMSARVALLLPVLTASKGEPGKDPAP